MRTETLVKAKRLGVRVAVLGLWVAAGVSGPVLAATFGQLIPLHGHISEMALDEPRGAIYAANFTAGEVDIVSTSSNQLVSSLVLGGQPSGLAMSADGQFLVVTNYNSFGGVATLSSVSVVNLNDLSRQSYAMSNPPLGVAFGSDGAAVIVTTADIERFRPAGGTFEQICALPACVSTTTTPLPVPAPKFPREITQASMASSGDGNYIYGVTDAFTFVYRVSNGAPALSTRLNTTYLHALAPPLASVSFDGSYAMLGQYLVDRQLRVMAEMPGTDTGTPTLGGHAIDFGLKTVYAYYPELALGQIPTGTPVTTTTGGVTTTTPSGPANLLPSALLVQDADNLNIRDRLLLPEPLVGRLVVGGGGKYLYGLSETGLVYVPLSNLATLPQVRPEVQQLVFQFDFCQNTPLQQTIQIDGTGDFSLSVSPGLKGVTFSPQSGQAPAAVTVTVDFSQYATVQGTTSGNIFISSNSAVNGVGPIAVSVNVKDADQRGQLVAVAGKLVDVQADPVRDQFYAVEQTHNQLLVFENSDLRLLGSFRVGNKPSWMSFTPDRHGLLVANSSGENLTVINLDTMQSQGYLFTPAGHEPVSVAADNGTILTVVRAAAATTQAGGAAQIDTVDLSLRAVFPLGRLGIYENSLPTDTAVTPKLDGSGIFIAGSDGTVMLWDAGRQAVVLARKDLSGLNGTIAAGVDNYVAAGNLLNSALVPQAVFHDTPLAPAGFLFTPDGAVRTAAPTLAVTDTGSVQRFNVKTPGVKLSPVRMVESPRTPQTFSFLRSLAGLRNGTLVSISTSGLVELPGAFDAGIAIPKVTAITNAADYSSALAPGGLVSIFGQNLAPDTAGAGAVPLPSTLAGICVTANGLRLPLLYASPTQINAQLPFELMGQAATTLHTPGGLSDIYYAQLAAAAPAVFQKQLGGQMFPTIVRASNGEIATLSNPLHPNETILVYATGMGPVGPPVASGAAGPSSPLATELQAPAVTLGGIVAPLYFAGLAPGFVGVYQLNVKVPGDAPEGMQVPLTIVAGGLSTTVNVRVVR